MNEEEAEAIWYCAEILSDNKNDIEHWKIVENLIDKQQKVIDLMAEDRTEISEPKVSKEAIIDFYFKKVEEGYFKKVEEGND